MRLRAAGPPPLFRGSLLLAPRGGGRGGRPAEQSLARLPAGPGAVTRLGVCRSFAGSTLRPTRAARGVLRLQRASGRAAPEEEKRRIANRAARAASVLRGRSWRAAGRA